MLDATDTQTLTETTETVTPDEAAPVDPAAAVESTILGGDSKGEAPAEPAAPAIPEKYELTAPDGMTFDDEAFALADPVFRELGLTNDAAQKLMPVAGAFAERAGKAAVEAHVAAQDTQFAATKAAWASEAEADPEMGGAKWSETQTLAAKALDALGFKQGSAFREFLTDTGLGNHPEMIRAMRRVGERVSDDTFERGGAPNNPPKSVAERWYPKKEGTN